jgi:hypothetical protein
MISDALSDEQTEKIDDLCERFGNLCGAINWDDLLGKEFVHAGRYVTPFTGSPYEGIILGRGDGSKLDANYKALRSILEECVKLIESNGGEGQVSVKETKKDDFTCSVFAPSESPNIGIAVGKWKDVIVFGFGGLGMMEESVKLLQGSGEAKGLITTDRFN